MIRFAAFMDTQVDSRKVDFGTIRFENARPERKR